ncbi:MAG: hypothetical protein HZB55_19490 [Deltaproteobacteria bacterium]|nr:hypothetical protein [Deltaproteobacteria bacterium]
MRSRWVLTAAFVVVASWSGQRAGWAAEEFPVPPPPLSEDYFPCMEKCHADMTPNPTPRELEEHTDIKLHHAEQFRWCLDCHDTQNRDKLHLQSGEKIDFTESYRLCGQCHGDKYRDWKKGVHGKRTGYWNGKKEYLLCAHCHNPHSPKFVLKPDPDHPDTTDSRPEPPPLVPGSASLDSHRAATHGSGAKH